MKLRIKYLLIVTLLVVISGLSLVKSSAAGTKLTKTVELNGDIITETLWNGVQLERMAIKAERAWRTEAKQLRPSPTRNNHQESVDGFRHN